MKVRKNFARSCAFVMVLAGLAACSNTPSESVDQNGNLADSIRTDEVGKGVSFGNHLRVAEEIDTVHSVLGVQTYAGEGGKKNLRFVAALSGYRGLNSAKFVRTVTSPSGEVVKESAEIPVDMVYTSVKDASSVKWSEEIDAATYQYFMVYTLRNIPEEHWLDKVEVSLVAKTNADVEITSTQKANVLGVEYTEPSGFLFKQNADEKERGVWHVEKNAPGAKVEVPAYNYQLESGSYHAVSAGPVVAIGDTGSTTGGFESCVNLEEVVLPDTIETFNRWCFSKANKLTSLRLPKNLKTIMGSAFNNTTGLKTIYYDAVALETVSGSIKDSTIETVKVSKAVTSLPNDRLFEEGKLLKVEYEGTEAEWAALINGKNNGMNIDNVICSDTEIISVNFHIGEGSVTYKGESVTGDYTLSLIKGKKVDNIGKPLLSGKFFEGWYTAETGGELYDFDAPVTGDLDLYARYGELPAGNSMDEPILLDGTEYSASVTTFPGMQNVYYKLTAPATDIYYFAINTIAIDTESSSSGVNTTNPLIRVYDETKTELPSKNYTIDASSAKVQQISSSEPCIYAIHMEANEVRYIEISAYYNSYYNDRVGYGTMDVAMWTEEGDSIDTAAELTYGEAMPITFSHRYDHKKNNYQHLLYKYTAEETKKVFLSLGTNSQWVSLTVYDSADLSRTYHAVRGSSNSSTIMNVETGHTYYIEATTNSQTDDAKTISVTIGDPAQGYDVVNPLPYEISENILEVTGLDIAARYYTFTVDQDSAYRFILTGGSSSYAKNITLMNSNGETIADHTEAGVTDDWYGGTTYASEMKFVQELTAGTYTMRIGYSGTSTSSTLIRLSVKTLGVGDSISEPDTTSFDASLAEQTFSVTADGRYFKFIAPTSQWYVYKITGTSANAELFGEGNVSLGKGKDIYIQLEAGKEYILYLTGNGDVTVNMTCSDELPEDGKLRQTAFTFVLDENHHMTIDPTIVYGSNVWFKASGLVAGKTYRIWSNNDAANDTKLVSTYVGDSTVSIATNDDDRNSHPDYTRYKYDFYCEFTIPADSEAFEFVYFEIKIENEACALYLGLEEVL